jgi:predicted secreted Zn-dependent protease
MGSRSIPRSRLKIITAITITIIIIIIITWTLDAQASSTCCNLVVVDPFSFFVYFLPCSSHRYNSR